MRPTWQQVGRFVYCTVLPTQARRRAKSARLWDSVADMRPAKYVQDFVRRGERCLKQC